MSPVRSPSRNGRPPVKDAATVATAELWLSDVALSERVELVRIDLPDEAATPLLERGVLPGCSLCPVRLTPFGDPVVRVDGTLVALRREVARCLCVRRLVN